MTLSFTYYQDAITRLLHNHYPELGPLPFHSPDLQKWVWSLSETFRQQNKYANGAYFKDRNMLAAYLTFIFPQSLYKIYALLSELIPETPEPNPRESYHILDIGTGLGASALGAYELLRERFPDKPLNVDLVDINRHALSFLSELIQEQSHFHSVKWNIVQSDIERFVLHAKKKWDCIILSLILSELRPRLTMVALIRKLLSLLNENGFLIIIEPASNEASHNLIALRNKLINYDIFITAPCLNKLICPLTEMQNLWCYRELRWQPPELMTFLNRKLYREITTLKFSYLILSNTRGFPASAGESASRLNLFRALSFPSHEKSKWVLKACDSNCTLRTLELRKKDITDDNRHFKKTCRGDLLHNIPDSLFHVLD